MSPADAEVPEAIRDRESEIAEQSERAPAEHSRGEAKKQSEIPAGDRTVAEGGGGGLREDAGDFGVQRGEEFEAQV